MHINEKEYAIAFSSANTPKETPYNPSQFKNPHETLCKTYITYLHKGLSEAQVRSLIKVLRTQADEEAKEGRSLSITAASKFFRKIAPACPRGIKALTEEDIQELVPVIQKNPEALFYYIRYHITPQLKIYSDVLTSTVHNFRTQFASSLSLSATPQAEAAHGLDTHFIPMKGTSGQVTHLLLTKCKDPSALHSLAANQPSDVLDEALELANDNPRIKAIIDIGAHFKGLANHKVAEKMRESLKEDKEVQAIVFFDENDGLFKVMDMASGNLQDYTDSRFDQEACQAFYDQSRCFGSDLKLAVDAMGLLMTGKNTTKAMAGQAAGRMRRWNKEQTVGIGYPKKIQKEIFKGKAADIKSLLVYWLTNQVRQEKDANFRSQEQQMSNEIRRALLDKLLGFKMGNIKPVNKEPDVDRAIDMLSHFDRVFFENDSINPWNMYAGITIDKDAKGCLSSVQKRCKKQVNQLNGINRREREIIYKRLEAYPAVWKTMALPNKVIGGYSDLGMECEVLQEQEIELEEEARIQKTENIQERKPMKWPEKLDLFSGKWVNPKRESLLLRKIEMQLAKISDKLTRDDAKTGWSRHVTHITGTLTCFVAGIYIGCDVVFVAAITTSSLAYTIIFGIGVFAAAGFLFLAYGSVIINKLTLGNHPVFRLKDLAHLGLPSGISKGANFFNNNLLVSNNYLMQNPAGFFEQKQVPFNAEQKPIFDLLVIQEEQENGKKDLKVMVIDQNDSVFFRRKLKADRQKEMTEAKLKARKRKIAIYNLHNGTIVSQGKNQFEGDELEKNAAFQELKAQAKFLNGEINYTEQELGKIKSKAEKIGIGPVGTMFEKHILPQHPINQKFLKNKPISQVLAL